MANEETLSKLLLISKMLEENLKKIGLEIMHLKSISDQDDDKLDSLLSSFKNEKKDEYTKLIDSLNYTPESMEQHVRDILTTLLTGTSEEIKIRIQNLNDRIEQDVRIILKRCYLEYKINEYTSVEEESRSIKQAILNVKLFKDSMLIPKDLNNVLEKRLNERVVLGK